MRTVRVVRMTRTQAPFTSTLPRGGRAITCPQCERVLSMELSTFGLMRAQVAAPNPTDTLPTGKPDRTTD